MPISSPPALGPVLLYYVYRLTPSSFGFQLHTPASPKSSASRRATCSADSSNPNTSAFAAMRDGVSDLGRGTGGAARVGGRTGLSKRAMGGPQRRGAGGTDRSRAGGTSG